jgi:osmotically-inducible protein OsmY
MAAIIIHLCRLRYNGSSHTMQARLTWESDMMTNTDVYYHRTDTDFDVEAAVRSAIQGIDNLRGVRPDVHVTALDGHIALTGYVQTPMQAVEVGRAAEYTPGVVRVDNQVLDDATLRRRVAEALGADPRTRDIPPGYVVNAHYGRVMLVGTILPEHAAAAAEVVQTVPGVRSVSVRLID